MGCMLNGHHGQTEHIPVRLLFIWRALCVCDREIGPRCA
jgi:hypothetical protein